MADIPVLRAKLELDTSSARADLAEVAAFIAQIKRDGKDLGIDVAMQVEQAFAETLGSLSAPSTSPAPEPSEAPAAPVEAPPVPVEPAPVPVEDVPPVPVEAPVEPIEGQVSS